MNDEELEWYALSPAERFAESQKLWDIFLLMGGSLDPEFDIQSPFNFLFYPDDPSMSFGGATKEERMATGFVTDTNLLDILSKLEPDKDLDGSLRKLLIRKVRNDLMKHRLIDEKFQKEYGMEFYAFKTSDWMKRPSFKVEQNYFDWEMAITMIDDLKETLETLQEPSQ